MTCERCGATFECGAGSGSCWCAEVDVGDTARTALAARYSECLCPDCLAAEASRRPDPSRARSAADAPRP